MTSSPVKWTATRQGETRSKIIIFLCVCVESSVDAGSTHKINYYLHRAHEWTTVAVILLRMSRAKSISCRFPVIAVTIRNHNVSSLGGVFSFVFLFIVFRLYCIPILACARRTLGLNMFVLDFNIDNFFFLFSKFCCCFLPSRIHIRSVRRVDAQGTHMNDEWSTVLFFYFILYLYTEPWAHILVFYTHAHTLNTAHLIKHVLYFDLLCVYKKKTEKKHFSLKFHLHSSPFRFCCRCLIWRSSSLAAIASTCASRI